MSVPAGRIEVPPSRIADEIVKIRRETADLDSKSDTSSEGESAPRIRATLSNLIILICEQDGAGSEVDVDTLISNLCVSHPSRFFIIRACNSVSDGGLRTSVSSRCVLADNGKHVCSEEIYIDVSKKRVELVHNLLLSLLVPDIETALLVYCDPSCSKTRAEEKAALDSLLESVVGLSSVVVYDSLLFHCYREGIDSLPSIDPEEVNQVSKPDLRDCSWLRIKRWQELVVAQFDSQQCLESDSTIEQLTISIIQRADRMTLGADSLLLAGWMMCCLEWSPEKTIAGGDELLRIACRRVDGTPAELRFVVSVDEEEHRESREQIAGVSVLVQSRGGSIDFSIERHPEKGTAQLSFRAQAQSSGVSNSCDLSMRKVPFKSPHIEDMIAQRMSAQGNNSQRDCSAQLAYSLACL